MIRRLMRKFVDLFPGSSEPRYFFSPSRINIIGEHIDYNGGFVLPCALDMGTYGLAQRSEEDKIVCYSLNTGDRFESSFPLPSYDEKYTWGNYLLAILYYLKDQGYQLGGMNIVIGGNIPRASGLSSSASIELLFGMMVSSLFHKGKIPLDVLAEAGIWCENEFFGLHTGVMDQYSIAYGLKDHALLLNTATKTHRYIPMDLQDTVLMIMDTSKPRELKDSKYNQRRVECEQALKKIQEKIKINELCDLREDDLDLVEALEDETLRKRARHCVTENIRVHRAIEALEKKDLVTLGKLLMESNDSLRDDYEVTGFELDTITKAANAVSSCLGARMTGAGFGGCALALVEKDGLEEFQDHVAREYYEKTGYEPHFYMSGIGDGVRELGA